MIACSAVIVVACRGVSSFSQAAHCVCGFLIVQVLIHCQLVSDRFVCGVRNVWPCLIAGATNTQAKLFEDFQ